MGALHDGHLSLVSRCSDENDLCVCSIFVNPYQFNDKKDLQNYPRDKKGDVTLLETTNCDVLFYPSVEEMYPEDFSKVVDLGPIENVLEGAHRPGHFEGVIGVVSRFFDIIHPDKAYFGLKDFQQYLVVKMLCEKLNYNIDIIGCETSREPDGLAMSSRNRLLSEQGRIKALLLNKTLKKVREKVLSHSLNEIQTSIKSEFEHSGIELEYFEIVDAASLKKVESLSDHTSVIACIAAYVEGVRLIDNLILIP